MVGSYLKLGVIGLLVFLCGQTWGQSGLTRKGTVQGHVSLKGEAVVGASVEVEGLKVLKLTDQDGNFSISEVPYGNYEMEISYLGAKSLRILLAVDSEVVRVQCEMEIEATQMETVTIEERSELAQMQSRPISINSLDAVAVRNQALGAEELLRQTTGVVVRQQGGLGSAVNVNLNGLNGNAVRVYYDGIPLEVFGGGVQINNIPVDVLRRMDVYKGVMPIDVGTDALGGGINLVPFHSYKEYFRTSYTFGSFNTHRLTAGGLKNLSDRVSISGNSFLNYSDNDFNMRNIQVLTERTLENGTPVYEESTTDIRRFHDRHFSGFAEGELLFHDFKWTDRLSLSASYNYRHDELQHGQQLLSVPIGQATRSFSTFSPRLDYRKGLFRDKIQLRYFGVFSYTRSVNLDSTTAVYDWNGQIFQNITNSSGSEISPIPTQRVGDNLGTAHRFSANYQLSKHLQVAVSDFFRYSHITGNDPVGSRLNINGEAVDPNTIPSIIQRNIFGAELKAEFWKKKITLVSFYKNYQYSAESIDILQRGLDILPIRRIDETTQGYGFALKYQVVPAVFVRGSFEDATRIPTETEIFGDFGAIVPNYTLLPETSENWNVGMRFEKGIAGMESFFVQIDAFVRNRSNLIRLDAFGPENSIFVNEAVVNGKGIELAIGAEPVETIRFTGNFTYQSNEIRTPQLAAGALEGAQVPNIPTLFFNMGLNYSLERIVRGKGDLELFWNYFFVDRFSINEVRDLATANPDFIVPTQQLHNVGLNYAPPKTPLQFSFTVRNVLNSRLFDNFRIPRPGTNFSIKINYSL